MTETRRSAVQKLAVGAAVIFSHLTAARNRTVTKLDDLFAIEPEHPCCPLPDCKGRMLRDRPGARLEWWRCSKCGRSLVGVPVREAA